MKSSVIAGAVFISLQQGQDQTCPFMLKCFHMNFRCMITPAQALQTVYQWSVPFKVNGKRQLHCTEQEILLNHVVIVELGPLKDVLLAHNV